MPYSAGIVNEEQPMMRGHVTDEVDRVLLEMGVPLQQPTLDWDWDTNVLGLEGGRTDALTYAPVDEDTRVSIKDLQYQWLRARNK